MIYSLADAVSESSVTNDSDQAFPTPMDGSFIFLLPSVLVTMFWASNPKEYSERKNLVITIFFVTIYTLS